MKPHFPFVLVTAVSLSMSLLTGCPDTKLPQTPPKIPEPKAAGFKLPAVQAVAATVSTLKTAT